MENPNIKVWRLFRTGWQGPIIKLLVQGTPYIWRCVAVRLPDGIALENKVTEDAVN